MLSVLADGQNSANFSREGNLRVRKGARTEISEEKLHEKKLIALAVAGAFAPALALADSNVTIYGRLNMDFEQVQAGGSTTPAADIPVVTGEFQLFPVSASKVPRIWASA